MSFQQFSQLYYRGRRFADVRYVLRYLKFRDLRNKYYADFWLKVAPNVGATAEPWEGGYWRISKGNRTTFVKQYHSMLDSKLMLDLMGNKAITLSLLQEAHCPIPRFKTFSLASLKEAERFIGDLGNLAVVKPMSGTGGGQGVTTGVQSKQDLRQAAKFASRFDSNLLIEEQLDGQSYRLLFLAGRFIDAVRRDPPEITGDGRSSIRKLVASENAKRLTQSPASALSALQIDSDCRNFLESHGLSPSSVLAAGKRTIIKRAANENSRQQNHCVKYDVHPEIIELGCRITKALGVRFAGIDLLTTDISRPLSETGGRIGEINTTPGLHHHYLISEPHKGTPVAEMLLDFIFSTGEGAMKFVNSPSAVSPKRALHVA